MMGTPRDERLARAVADLAHDVRAPLNVIGMAADVLEGAVHDGSGGEAPARIRKCARIIRDQSHNLARRLELLLVAVSAPSGTSAFDLRQVAEEAVATTLMRTSHSQRGIACRFPSESVSILGLGPCLKSALVEVLTNAVEATAVGESVRFEMEAEPGGVKLRIEDRGAGIPDGDRSRIFAPDFTTKGPGRGFGLRFAMSIVAAHGGTIEVKRGVERGTCLQVILPRT